MKKIHAAHSDKDLIICAGSNGRTVIYFRQENSKDRYFLLQPSGALAISSWFKRRGKANRNGEYEVMIRELYKFDDYRNRKLAHTIDRIPDLVNYVLKYEILAGDNSCYGEPAA